MNALAILRQESLRIDARTRWLVGASLILHVVLLALLSFLSRADTSRPVITEITWIEPAAPAPPPAPRKEKLQPRPKPQPAPERQFERKQQVAEVAPEPQKPVMDDALKQKLKRMNALPERPKVLSAAGGAVPALWSPSRPAAAPATGIEPKALRREASAKAKPLPLKREAGPARRLAIADVEKAAPLASEIDRDGGADASRVLGSTLLTGPAADRPVLSHTLPDYPEWAKREGIEASVSLYFLVLPDGRVKKSILIEKTSGFSDFDERARSALLTWRFEALPPGSSGEQWGTITFHFRLRDGS